jgi:site-specific DNA recombinase
MSAQRMDGYIRVSRRAGRAGESFISPEVQRQRIEGWAKANGVEVARWWEELDQSGAKRERPMFQEALARCELGETGGMVVAKLDRFARSAVDALESIKRLNEASSRLVSVEDGFDGSTPMGRFAIGILTLIAELELERIKGNWDAAVSEGIKRGVHISAHVPTGYVKNPKSGPNPGRLEPDPLVAPMVAEAFRMRATGTPYTKIAAFLEENGALPVSGNPNWSVSGVIGMLANPVYLGQARSGRAVNDHAHEPIVTRAEWDAVRATKSLQPARDGSVASQAMLGGLVRCAGCDHTLKITGNLDAKAGKRYPVYYCSGRYAKGPCPARATIRASYLDRYVEEQVLAALRAEGGLLAQARQADAELEQAQRTLEAAEHELNLYLQTDLIAIVGQETFIAGVQARQARVDEARERVATLHSQTLITDELISGNLLEAWPQLTTPEKRTLMHGLLDRVVLTRAPARGREAVPVDSRTQIVLRGNVLLGPKPDDAT